MSEDSVVSAVVRDVTRLATGTWGDSSALTLTFELADGRITEPTYIPGQWQIRDFIQMLDVPSTEHLIGATLRVVLLDPYALSPTVTEVLPFEVPEPFRKAFGDGC